MHYNTAAGREVQPPPTGRGSARKLRFTNNYAYINWVRTPVKGQRFFLLILLIVLYECLMFYAAVDIDPGTVLNTFDFD